MTRNYRMTFFMVIAFLTALSLGYSVFASSPGRLRVQGEGDYIIQRGDTLWDIAEKHLGDPLLWPQIWKLNPYITDPHWIYPNNRLTLPTPQADMITRVITEEPDEEVIPPVEDPEPVLPPPPTPKPFATRSDMYSSGYLSSRTPDDFFGFIIGGEEINKQMMAEGDIVYIDKGSEDGIIPGDIFFTVEQGPRVYHPVSNAFIGHMYRNTGIIQVLCVQEHTATTKIIESFDVVYRKQMIEPYEEYFAPTIIALEEVDICEPAKGELEGYLIASRDARNYLAEKSISYIDIGTNDGVAAGDLFVSFKIREGFKPDLYTGDLVVLRAEENTSTVMIYRSRHEIEIGDYIRQK